MSKRKVIGLLVVIFLTIALVMFLPGLCPAGSLEPSDPPGPTMKTLDEIYHKPIWNMYDQVFVDWLDNPRFAVNDNGTPADVTDDTVLDKETGLVWVRNPDSIQRNWISAHDTCTRQAYYSGRRGWRLPMIQELTSLVDMRVAGYPKLSSGHPFNNVVLWDYYWSATTYVDDASRAWHVRMGDGTVYYGLTYGVYKTSNLFVWCVRGGQGVDPQ